MSTYFCRNLKKFENFSKTPANKPKSTIPASLVMPGLPVLSKAEGSILVR